jgi:acetyl esterase/lipase
VTTLQRRALRAATGAVIGFGRLCLAVDRLYGRFAPGPPLDMHPDLAFAPGERGKLDLYAPADARAVPVVIFFYGGTWQIGTRQLYRFVGEALARRGIVGVVADYRLYPDVRFPDFLRDGAAAVRWARDNAARYGGDPDSLFLMGHSAGAHMAAMLALDARWLDEVGLTPRSHVAGFIGLAGPYDLSAYRSHILEDVFGDLRRPGVSPISFVTPQAPPAFLAAGARDALVRPEATRRMASGLRQAGAEVVERLYPGGHYRIIFAMLRMLNALAPVADDAARFVHAAAQARTSPRCAERKEDGESTDAPPAMPSTSAPEDRGNRGLDR